jgi:hypothetical protein
VKALCYTLVTRDGDTRGAVELGRPDWPVGSVIYRGDKPNLRVVGHIEPDEPGRLAVLVVELVE